MTPPQPAFKIVPPDAAFIPGALESPLAMTVRPASLRRYKALLREFGFWPPDIHHPSEITPQTLADALHRCATTRKRPADIDALSAAVGLLFRASGWWNSVFDENGWVIEKRGQAIHTSSKVVDARKDTRKIAANLAEKSKFRGGRRAGQPYLSGGLPAAPVVEEKEIHAIMGGVSSPSAAKRIRNRAMLAMGWCCALRVSEVVGLRMLDLEIPQQPGGIYGVRIRGAKNARAADAPQVVDSTLAGEDFLSGAMDEWLQLRGRADDGYVFPKVLTAGGELVVVGEKAITTRQAENIFSAAVLAAFEELPSPPASYSFHSLRHGRARNLIRFRNWDFNQIMDLCLRDRSPVAALTYCKHEQEARERRREGR